MTNELPMLNVNLNPFDTEYLRMIDYVLERGHKTSNRTGVATTKVFGYQAQFDMSAGFPLLTTKKVHIKSIVHELIWFLRGDTNIKYLNDNGVRIWDEWADENGDLGPVYGSQWRRWKTVDGQTIDQIQNALDDLRKDPTNRRVIVTAWNPGEKDAQALPPCHCLFQFATSPISTEQRYHELKIRGWDYDVRPSELDAVGAPAYKLHLQLYQRSADLFLGVPFNIASYAMKLHIFAHLLNMVPGKFIHTFGDLHIYENHEEQVRRQYMNGVNGPFFDPPRFRLSDREWDIDSLRFEDFMIEDYQSHEQIQGKVAV